MSSEVKQLIVVAEGTAALGPYWQTIVSDYLEKIIRFFFLMNLLSPNPRYLIFPFSNLKLGFRSNQALISID